MVLNVDQESGASMAIANSCPNGGYQKMVSDITQGPEVGVNGQPGENVLEHVERAPNFVADNVTTRGRHMEVIHALETVKNIGFVVLVSMINKLINYLIDDFVFSKRQSSIKNTFKLTDVNGSK